MLQIGTSSSSAHNSPLLKRAAALDGPRLVVGRVEPVPPVTPVTRSDATLSQPTPPRSREVEGLVRSATVDQTGDANGARAPGGAGLGAAAPPASTGAAAAAPEIAAAASRPATASSPATAPRPDVNGAAAPNAADAAPPTDAQGLTKAEREAVDALAARDREVRDHEEAHARVGGPFASAPSYELTIGPDGRAYAVAGSVAIDVSPVKNDPEATIAKMDVVKAAALAPAEPSGADRLVAAQADTVQLQAVADLAAERRESARGGAQGLAGLLAFIAPAADAPRAPLIDRRF